MSSDLVTQDVSRCGLTGRTISVYSPLSITVADANGDRAGVASDGATIQDSIPGADYEMFGEHKFVYLPTDDGQTYTVTVGGTGNGEFTLTDSSLLNGSVSSTDVFSDIPVTPALTGSLNMSAAPALALDTNGDGTTDEVVQPSETLDAEASKDFYPDPAETPQASDPLPSLPVAVSAPLQTATSTPVSAPAPDVAAPASTSSTPVDGSDSAQSIGLAASAAGSTVMFGHAFVAETSSFTAVHCNLPCQSIR